jgi:hypothetical protein
MKLKISLFFLLGLSLTSFKKTFPTKTFCIYTRTGRLWKSAFGIDGYQKEYMLLTYRNTYKSLDDLNQDELRLGGLRINPITNISSAVNVNNLKIRKIKIWGSWTKTLASVTLLGRQMILKYPAHDDCNWCWTLGDWVASAKAKLTEAMVNANIGNPFSWLNDNATILVKCFQKTERLYWMIYQLDRLSRMLMVQTQKQQNLPCWKQERRG